MSKSQHNYFKLFSIISLIFLFYFGYKLVDKMTVSQSTKAGIEENTDTNTDEFRQSVEKIVKEYITNNPEVIIESIEMMHRRKINEMEAQIQAAVRTKLPEILESNNINLNNDKKDAEIVFFYDYACNYCKKANDIINGLIKNDDKLEVIYIPMPLLGEFSNYMTKFAIATYELHPEKFKAIHDEIMTTSNLTKEKLQGIVEKHNIAFDDIEIEMSKPKVIEQHNKILSWISSMKINGAPAYVINDSFYPGLLEQSIMQKLISDQRIAKNQHNENKDSE